MCVSGARNRLVVRGSTRRSVVSGLYPWDPVEAAFADAAVDAVTDNHFKLAPTFFMKDLEKRVRAIAQVIRTVARVAFHGWV